MDLQRTDSDTIEKSFHDSLKEGDSSFLLDTNELKLDDVLRLRTETSDGAEPLGASAMHDSLLTLETGGLAEDEWLVASPSEAPEEKPRRFDGPAARISNPRDAILSSAPPERMHSSAKADLQPKVESRKRSISLPEPAGSTAAAQAQRGRRSTADHAGVTVPPEDAQDAILGVKAPKPGTVEALENFTPSPARLTMLPSADRWGDSRIPRSPLAKSPAASSTDAFAANAGMAKGSSPSKLPSPGAIPTSPKRPLTPRASSLNRAMSPVGESRIPKPHTGAHSGGLAAPETRKQRYAPRAMPERSPQRGGGRAGSRAGGRPRSAKPKSKLEELENGWVGGDVPKEDDAEDAPFAGVEALKLAEELSAASDAKIGDGGAVESGPTKPVGNATHLEADSSSTKVDACTQVTPKVADGTTAPSSSPGKKVQACSCCAIM